MTRLSITSAMDLVVQDTGFGIKPEDQGKIFQRFFRSEDDQVRAASGTGLGLNISKNLVEMQGGRIWFHSAPGGTGTVFKFVWNKDPDLPDVTEPDTSQGAENVQYGHAAREHSAG